MSEIFSRFSFHAGKFHGQVWICLAGIWLVVLLCTLASINSQPFSARQRRFWILAVCLFPLVGLLAYLPFSCRWEQLAQLLFIRLQGSHGKTRGANAKQLSGGRTP